MEVERCLRVLDGAVAVFDASAGVEVKSAVIFFCVCVCNLSGKGERFSQTLCLRKGKMKFSCPIQSVSVLLWGPKDSSVNNPLDQSMVQLPCSESYANRKTSS